MGELEFNAEKSRLRFLVKKLDAEYPKGTLDTKGYLRTREELLSRLWELKSGGHY
jgi:hypothetical protein